MTMNLIIVMNTVVIVFGAALRAFILGASDIHCHTGTEDEILPGLWASNLKIF